MANLQSYGIKDSGHRRQFETGAVRDMHEGKGRYDLIPWEAIHELALHCEQGALKYGERNCEKGIPISSLVDSAFRHLSKYMQGADDERTAPLEYSFCHLDGKAKRDAGCPNQVRKGGLT